MPDEPIPVRLSHLLRYCAVGAVVRGPDRLVTVQDTSAWRCGPDHEIRYVDQVRVALGIGKTLRSPPTARVEDGEVTGCPIPATRFPRWTRCSRCGLLHYRPWKRASTARPDTRSRSSGATCAGQADRPACGGRLEVFVYRVEARKSAKWCAGLVRMCRYVQYGSRGRQTGRFEGARARG